VAVDELTYPLPVADRSGPAGGGGGGLPVVRPSPPRTFVFAFVIRALANTRSTTSSPQLRGPSIIRGLHFAKGGTPEGLQGLSLGKSFSSITEVNVAVATPRAYTPLFKGLPAAGSALSVPSDATQLVDMQTTLLHDADDLGIIVLDRDWFLTITQASAAVANPDDFVGYVTILDEVPEETLRNFL